MVSPCTATPRVASPCGASSFAASDRPVLGACRRRYAPNTCHRMASWHRTGLGVENERRTLASWHAASSASGPLRSAPVRAAGVCTAARGAAGRRNSAETAGWRPCARLRRPRLPWRANGCTSASPSWWTEPSRDCLWTTSWHWSADWMGRRRGLSVRAAPAVGVWRKPGRAGRAGGAGRGSGCPWLTTKDSPASGCLCPVPTRAEPRPDTDPYPPASALEKALHALAAAAEPALADAVLREAADTQGAPNWATVSDWVSLLGGRPQDVRLLWEEAVQAGPCPWESVAAAAGRPAAALRGLQPAAAGPRPLSWRAVRACPQKRFRRSSTESTSRTGRAWPLWPPRSARPRCASGPPGTPFGCPSALPPAISPREASAWPTPPRPGEPRGNDAPVLVVRRLTFRCFPRAAHKFAHLSLRHSPGARGAGSELMGRQHGLYHGNFHPAALRTGRLRGS